MHRSFRPRSLALGLMVLLGLASTSSAKPPTDDWGRAGTTKDCEENCRIFLVNFVILSPVTFDDPEAKMQAEIDILNRYFRTREGYQLFEFVKKRVTTYEEVQAMKGCRKLRALGHLKHEFNKGKHRGERLEAIDECFAQTRNGASTLFDHHAINFYVYDNHGSSGSSGGAHRTKNERWPYLLVDHERLGHKQAVEEHEMGHAFAKLEHVCVKGAKADSATPIMTTGNNWPGATNSCRAHGGRTGDRSLGFSDHTESYLEPAHREIAQIVSEAEKVQRALGPEGSPPPKHPAQW